MKHYNNSMLWEQLYKGSRKKILPEERRWRFFYELAKRTLLQLWTIKALPSYVLKVSILFLLLSYSCPFRCDLLNLVQWFTLKFKLMVRTEFIEQTVRFQDNLNDILADAGISKLSFSKKLGMHRNSFYYKLKRKAFTAGELQAIANTLNEIGVNY